MSAPGGSAFPRIGDYAFLSDCHTGALVAPDGSGRVDVPAALRLAERLRRDAGPRRRVVSGSGRAGVAVPVARRYEPGTNVLETSWMTDTGWVVVTEALTLAERANTAPVVPGRVPPTHEPEQALVRIAQCVEGDVELEIGCDLRYDYGATPADVVARARARASRPRTRAAAIPPVRLISDAELELGDDRRRARRRTLREDEGCFCALAWGEPKRSDPELARRRLGAGRVDVRVLARLARRRALPRPPLARAPAALGADPQGADLRADRSAGRRADDVAARDSGRRAQLGLPLHLDPRRDLHALGDAHARLRPRGAVVRRLRARRLPRRRRAASDHVRDRGRARADRAHARPPQRLRGRAAGADRQRRLQPAPERRLRRAAGLDLHPHQGPGPAAGPGLGDRHRAGRGGDRGLGRARPGDLGGARRAEALRLLEDHVLGRGRPRRAARRAAQRGIGARRALVEDRRADPRRGARARRHASAGCCASTTTPTRSMPRRCSRRWSASCRPTTTGSARPCSRSPTS